MASIISERTILTFRERLQAHPVYGAITDIEDLRRFMTHHVYSVWDFMSLIKFLQNAVAPARVPWVPAGDADARRFINELVLEEESDQGPSDERGQPTFGSHFELYLGAMEEIGADTSPARTFVRDVRERGIQPALQGPQVPAAARAFTGTTFRFIDTGKPHVVAAALALGREHVIPCMFRAFLQNMGVTETQAPVFHYYLNRHIHLDEDFHAPLSLRLLDGLCGDDRTRQTEAVEAAEQAVAARLAFWDGVLEAIH
ncbi:MAG TPA: DUF3050 domain-containing protein [Gammaproteobacteria bacterium]|nr:DUF3050 domain-containing protein [Gammaproteobacteria bacterium]